MLHAILVHGPGNNVGDQQSLVVDAPLVYTPMAEGVEHLGGIPQLRVLLLSHERFNLIQVSVVNVLSILEIAGYGVRLVRWLYQVQSATVVLLDLVTVAVLDDCLETVNNPVPVVNEDFALPLSALCDTSSSTLQVQHVI